MPAHELDAVLLRIRTVARALRRLGGDRRDGAARRPPRCGRAAQAWGVAALDSRDRGLVLS